MKRFKAAYGVLLAAIASLLASPALALSWKQSGGLPPGAQADLRDSYFPQNGRTPTVSFSADGTVGLLTLQKPANAVYHTVDGGRTWSKINDASFVGVYVLTNTRYLAVGQLGTSFNNLRGRRLFTGGPAGTGFAWTSALSRPNVAGAAAVDVRGVAPFEGGAFVLGNAVWEDGRGGLIDTDPNAPPGPTMRDTIQYIWRYDAATNTFTEVLSNKYNKAGVGPGSGTPYIVSIAAAGRNLAWAAWIGKIFGARPTDPTQHFDGQVTAWDGTRWTTIRPGQNAGESGFELFGLSPNQLWMTQIGSILRYYNGQEWTELLPFTPGVARNLKLSMASTPGSLVVLDPRAERTAGTFRGVVAEHVWRWDAGTGQLAYNQFKAPDGSEPSGGDVSTSSSGLTAMVWGRKSQTNLLESIVEFKGQVLGTGGWGPIDSVLCTTNSTAGPCSVVNLVALPSSAVLVSEDAGGVYYLA